MVWVLKPEGRITITSNLSKLFSQPALLLPVQVPPVPTPRTCLDAARVDRPRAEPAQILGRFAPITPVRTTSPRMARPFMGGRANCMDPYPRRHRRSAARPRGEVQTALAEPHISPEKEPTLNDPHWRSSSHRFQQCIPVYSFSSEKRGVVQK